MRTTEGIVVSRRPRLIATRIVKEWGGGQCDCVKDEEKEQKPEKY